MTPYLWCWWWCYPSELAHVRRMQQALRWHERRGSWPAGDQRMLGELAESERAVMAVDARLRYRHQRRVRAA